MSAYLQCMSHTPLIGHVDPSPAILAEVDAVVAGARERIARFAPELVILFAPDHYNGFFYDVMPSFCIGMAAHAIGDFGTAVGALSVPQKLAEACATAVLEAGVDAAVSYRMQVDHGFAQPLELLLGGLDRCPVIPVFINSVAIPLPGFQRARLLGEAIGAFARTLNKRVLFLASGGLSHQPPVPELASVDARMADRLMGSGRNLPADEREARQQRVILAAQRFVENQYSLHPINPEWDQWFLDILSEGHLAELDGLDNDQLSTLAGKSTHEVKTWVAAFAALSAFGPYRTDARYYRPVPEWIAGFGALSAQPSMQIDE
ncbi:3-carboxyethylcatechol 2,3-dioxygenase [Pseudomonas fluorescens]|uniref:2,3-dihydroxyphenylpropionate/2,3-dihydroxicinnamic acid 1,2-dioxygenase n=1 Tax=Pseudomonas fluorescens TaxID=294 RepID=A0A423LFZ5_PSEFL|nr:3-carboxyethylcatechol 2,3-dioxygenase [Pseudomonas fluorescens]RON67198.1 3-(2,3-dihydroxyphenyl)propionate dioxygenase [Pseudomonas fluorescens]